MDDIATVHQMPAEIIKAVIAVMRDVKKLGREGSNTFARYRYTSVDQFYEALGPLMAQHGLMTIVDEMGTTVNVRETVTERGEIKKGAWLTAEYLIHLCHESGAVLANIRRSIQVPATGPQSFASAQSYVEKYFLRTLFKVPTGDVDEVDASAPQPLPALEPVKKVSKTEIELIEMALDHLPPDTRGRILGAMKVQAIEDLPAAKFGKVSTFLNDLMAKQKEPAE